MRFLRFSYQGKVLYGDCSGDKIRVIEGGIFGDFRLTDQVIPLSAVKVLAPVTPSKIVCVGLNYSDHRKEMKEDAVYPKFFLKPPSAVIGQGDAVVMPSMSQRVDYEAELAVVIGKRAKNITNAKDYILGYTCMNDVTARDLQKIDGQWTRAKGFDTFAPLGPVIADDIDPSDLKIEMEVNGEVKQSSLTSCMIWDVDYLVCEISKIMTLLPGDVIATGTPSGIGSVQEGDIMKLTIEKIGCLTNEVIKE